MTEGMLQLRGTVPGVCFPNPTPVGSSAGCGFIPRVRRLCELEPGLPMLMLGLVLRLSGGGGSAGHGPGTGGEVDEESSHGSQESQRPRLGKAGVGLGKGGVGRGKLGPGRTLGDERHPPGAPVSAGQRTGARQGAGVSETVAARGDGDRANAGMGNVAGIEERVREIEQAKAAKRSGAAARLAAARLTRRRPSSGPTRRGSAGVSPKLAERLKMIDEAKLSVPTRSLRERHTRVNYEEGSDESKERDDWSASQGGMIMSEEAAEAAATQGGGAGQQRVARAAKGQGALGLGTRRRRNTEDKDANPLGQELSGSGEEGGDGGLEETETAREERRKRRLEEEAAEAAEDAEGEDGDVHKRYRAFRRKMMREFWGESPEPPPEPRREYTFEEDLALVLKSHLHSGFIYLFLFFYLGGLGTNSQKVTSIVALYDKRSGSLTFENLSKGCISRR